MNPPIGERMRLYRNTRNLSQLEVEQRTGLRRYNISRVENGHTTPTLATVDKITRALGIPLYQLFYECRVSRANAVTLKHRSRRPQSRREDAYMKRLQRSLIRIPAARRRLLLFLASYLASPKRSGA